MTDNPALAKLISVSRPIKIGTNILWPIPQGKLTREEIEMLREEDELRKQLHRFPLIANFLPDDIRPKGIPKM